MVTINTLNGGNITITTTPSAGGGSEDGSRTATRVWYGDEEDVYYDYEIQGEIDSNYDSEEDVYFPTNQIPNVE